MLDSILGSKLTLESLSICVLSALILGIIVALTHKATGKYNKNYLITLTILPLMVETIMIMVNGSLGTGIAIAGAFSLIRFRSMPGTSKEILSIFIAMTIGIILGMGYIGYACIVTIVSALSILLLSNVNIFQDNKNKILKIVIPENLDYIEIFNDEFNTYLNNYELMQVKTVNMGSLFELTYSVNIKENVNEKEFIDKLRVKNGNLKIMLSKPIDENIL